MNLYIDRENINSFIKNHKHHLYNDCLKTMQKQFNIYFNFTKEDIAKDEIFTNWLKFFTSGVGETNKFSFNLILFPDRPLKSNSYIRFDKEQLSSIYLINDIHIKLLKEKGAILIGEQGEEFEIMNQVFLLQKDYKFEKKFRIGSPEFTKWSDLENYSSAVSDILFIDPFIINDLTDVNVNLIPFLKILASKCRCKLNLVLYVKNSESNISYEILSPIIRHEIEQVTGIKPNFTLIKVRDQRDVESFAEHDRTILTNYIRVYSGDTFNYFKPDGTKKTKGREIHFSSFADTENHKLAKELIDDIQKNLDVLPDENVHGDKKSNFLNFK